MGTENQEGIIKFDGGKLNFNKEKYLNLPNFSEVDKALRSINFGGALKLGTEIINMLSEVEEKIKGSTITNLIPNGVEKKLAEFANNANSIIRTAFERFSKNELNAGENLVKGILDIGKPENLGVLAKFTRNLETRLGGLGDTIRNNILDITPRTYAGGKTIQLANKSGKEIEGQLKE